MDTSLLSLEEHFTTYVFEESNDAPSLDNTGGYFNEWEDEKELNGDIGLIPESSNFDDLKDMSDLTDSPSSLLYQKMLDWSQMLYVDGVDVFTPEDITPFSEVEKPDSTSNFSINNFDLATYISEPLPKPVKSAGKKIDKEAQKYIIDDKKSDDEIDVETVETSLPVLEATDALSLLEQFEATEKPNSKINFALDLKTPEKFQPPVEIFEDKTSKEKNKKNKQILEALPQELIARINESGKRKPITVIPPIPTKKRTRSVDCVKSKMIKVNDQVKLDHDYCATSSIYPKEPRKDSGFQSSEEDDRSVIRNQPTVKTADGKLMVSLLKVNTIRNEKKKLNLEEYKKRRFIDSSATSQNNSPGSSTCSSPLPEDENAKRLKHQEKLMKMAADLLNTPAKKQAGPNIKIVSSVKIEKLPEKVLPPPDFEVKTYVSTAANTDISSINSTKGALDEIKPLLQKVSDKINSNSFITSLIENIPKVKTKSATYVKSENQEVVREDKIIHYLKKDREPVKTGDVACQTDFDEEPRYRRRIEERRNSTSSSSSYSSSSRRSRRRSSSTSSRSSRSSSSVSSRSSRSRSRSISPKRKQQYSAEYLREVEERRVIYVGRISKGTTKEDLRRRFSQFGTITNVSLHFRDYGDNYGFVTFINKEDAFAALEHGNDHAYPKYDLSFGGRRIFCKTSYSDLDNMREDDYSYYVNRTPDDSFDALLRAAQEKIRKRKP